MRKRPKLKRSGIIANKPAVANIAVKAERDYPAKIRISLPKQNIKDFDQKEK